MGLEVESQKSHNKDGQHEADEGRDEWSDPLGPTEHVSGLASFKVQIHLLEDIFGLERDHPSLVSQFLHGLEKLGSRDVAKNSFGVPIPIEDSGVGSGVPDGVFPIDLVIFQPEVAPTRDVDGCSFGNQDVFLNRRTTFLSGHYFFVGVYQVVVIVHSKHSFVGGLDLEVTVPGGGFGVFYAERSEASLSEVWFQDLPPLAVVNVAQLEALTEFRGG